MRARTGCIPVECLDWKRNLILAHFGLNFAKIIQDNQEVLSSKQEIFRKHQAKYLNVLYNKFDACWISLRHGIDVFKKLFLHLAVILASYAATQNGCWL